ncbi:ras-related protein Rab-3D isoform X1 [Felis catus]|uniref:Ras-related protein Rab-3 n=1 Tax=Felis catus TaxID=9685 RepID=A0ABI7ZLE3_FELCA|nr:ras-related protein Rab-3D isoform X1 [Felis catus]XP_019673304.2 ras-related protein Rab-3D isoform X1 [Felis catus]
MASAGDPPTGPRDAADQNFDYMFKLLLIGNSSVGKTSFLFRYADDSFTPAFVSTVGIDFKVKTVYRHDKRIKLQIWDTAGQERYRTITTAYYRGAMGFLLMYDVANQESFTAVQDWATQIKTYSWDNAQVILVGNKCDLEDERVVPTEDGRRLADDLGFEFFEASAKENINVKQVFERLVDVICGRLTSRWSLGNRNQCPRRSRAGGRRFVEFYKPKRSQKPWESRLSGESGVGRGHEPASRLHPETLRRELSAGSSVLLDVVLLRKRFFDVHLAR